MARYLTTLILGASIAGLAGAQEAGEAELVPVAFSASREVSVTAAAGELAAPIVLVATATVSDETIRLGDVAELPDGSPYAEVVLGPSPLPGHRRQLGRGQVELRLIRAGLADPAILSGADSVVVTRVAKTYGAADVRAALATLVSVPVTIERLPPRRPLPVGSVSYRLRGDLPEPLPERFNVPIDVLVNGQVADSLVVAVRLAAPPAPVAQTVAARPAATPAAAPTPAAPAAPPAPSWKIKRGDPLTVTAVAGRVRISFQAEARSTGTAGDVIECQALIGNERRTVAARLVAPDRAVMEF